MVWVPAYILPFKSEWQYTNNFSSASRHFQISGIQNSQSLPFLICQAEDLAKYDIRKSWIKDDPEVFTFDMPEFFVTRRLAAKVLWREGFLSGSANMVIKVWQP